MRVGVSSPGDSGRCVRHAPNGNGEDGRMAESRDARTACPGCGVKVASGALRCASCGAAFQPIDGLTGSLRKQMRLGTLMLGMIPLALIFAAARIAVGLAVVAFL